ncbi:WD40 repeat-like protein [Peniophora sp. CONT]|nr:WD40 repeat-like protein [Peniophora sp. CONT]
MASGSATNPSPMQGPSNGRSSSMQVRACGCSSKSGRNLVVCIDGAANRSGKRNTNVKLLYDLVLQGEGDHQRARYNDEEGVPKPSRTLRNTGTIVHKAYIWLVENYEDGDCIFLFGSQTYAGFSRGAYQVRVLSAIIDKVGLVNRGNDSEEHISSAFTLYANLWTSEILRRPTTTGDFKNRYSRCIKVHFVGAWDTVPSIGIVQDRTRIPGSLFAGTADGMKHVCYFRHALALDEPDVKFLPAQRRTSQSAMESQNTNHTKEVWFAGSHYDLEGDDHSPAFSPTRPSLGWMIHEASTAGLRLDFLAYFFAEGGKFVTNRYRRRLGRLFWENLFITVALPFPINFLVPVLGNGTSNSRRAIKEGQRIHVSVGGRYGFSMWLTRAHPPFARLHPTKFWRKVKTWEEDDIFRDTWMELDFSIRMEGLTDQYIDCEEIDPDGDRRRTQLELLHAHLSGHNRPLVVQEIIRRLEDDRPIATSAVYIYDILAALKILAGHTSLIWSVAFSPDGKRIVSGSKDQTIRIWDTETGQTVASVIEGHGSYIRSVAFSPDGEHIISGSNDRTIRLWDGQTGNTARKPFEGHDGYVNAVVYSSNGTHAVSGSEDGTLRAWDVVKGLTVGKPYEGHDGPVYSVAFSPDDDRVASGSEDCTVRIWDVKKGEMEGGPFEGHDGPIFSVAFSPSGEHVVSGSGDHTIRIWDVKTGKLVYAPYTGHDGQIYSVAFCPDGKRIVSASYDKTIRIWDVQTGQLVWKPYEGHDGPIYSVAFSPDGTRVVSGSYDETVRIWDVIQEHV